MKNLRLKLLLLCVMSIITLGASATLDKNYLCFTANTANSTVELVKKGDVYDAIMQYSTDEGENWQTIDFDAVTTTGTITLEKVNDKVYFRNIRPANKVPGFSKDDKDNHYQFVMSGSIAASGNVMSLVDLDVETTTIPNWFCFTYLFYECSELTSAPELPATQLKAGCYQEMFSKCYRLMKAPELPATTLANRCYLGMFNGCEKLTEAPDLPATTLCTNCYTSMFARCTNLKSIKVGFTDWYDNAATYAWLYGTAADGVFICPDELPMNDNYSYGIPYNWTRVYEVKANKDPESVNYYSTFYSGTNAYEVPEGVTAYTGEAEGNVLNLTPVADGIIPADEAVILKATQSQVYLSYTTTSATKSTDNMLEGTDEETTLGANQYALSLGQNGVGFYLWNGKSIGANKAYLTLTASTGAKAFTFQFDDGETTGILKPVMDEKKNSPAYNLNGVRVNDSYKGIVIKNGKKIYQK